MGTHVHTPAHLPSEGRKGGHRPGGLWMQVLAGVRARAAALHGLLGYCARLSRRPWSEDMLIVSPFLEKNCQITENENEAAK